MEDRIARLDAVLPGIKQSVVFKEAATPRTFERYTANTDGATSAWSWNPHKAFYKDMFSLNVSPPIRNLLNGSCWALQLGGFTGAIRAARECVKKIG